jgi:formylmethanofuran--tetrahydromethanopterin N-formyltransferase
LFFTASLKRLEHTVVNRAGQALMTCPTTAVFDGLPDAAERFTLGGQLRYFGDGFQKSKLLLGRRYWRIPVMDGEFMVEHEAGADKGVAGGNLIIQGANEPDALSAARRAAQAVDLMPGVIAPFPGGIARSGSKVGSRYKKLSASTADAYCPTLRGRTSSSLHTGATCAYELVVDGMDSATVANAMRAALHAAVGRGIVAISAGNYGGKLGRHHIHLRELLQSAGD